MAEASTDLGRLVYAATGNALAHNRENGRLVYKCDAAPRGWTKISFAWDKTARDLDICAYWSAAKDMKVGFRYGGAGLHESGPYKIEYSGDITAVGGSEWVKIIMSPWSVGTREFIIHLNYYDYDPESHPGNTCTVVASQEGGKTFIKKDVVCSSPGGTDPATESSNYVTVRFDKDGKLIGIV